MGKTVTIKTNSKGGYSVYVSGKKIHEVEDICTGSVAYTAVSASSVVDSAYYVIDEGDVVKFENPRARNNTPSRIINDFYESLKRDSTIKLIEI